MSPYDEECEGGDLLAFLKILRQLEERETSCLPSWFHFFDQILAHFHFQLHTKRKKILTLQMSERMVVLTRFLEVKKCWMMREMMYCHYF